jgi:hypothetical protein
MTEFIANRGVGDACRQAAVLWRDYGRFGKPVRVLVESEPTDDAAQVYENLSFIEHVERIPFGAWWDAPLEYRVAMGCPEALVAANVPWTRGCLTLPTELLRYPVGAMGCPGIVVQPRTSTFKQRSLQARDFSAHGDVCVIGSAADRDWTCSGNVSDYRGTLSIAGAMDLIARTQAVIGVESWAVILGALFSKPVVQEVSARAFRDLVPLWSKMFPTMGFRAIHAPEAL